MVSIRELGKAYRGKKVFITGHTGFKGSWLSLWLSDLGATTYGYALAPPTDPSLFQVLRLDRIIQHEVADIRDREQLKKSIMRIKPDIIFHLAAQSLVRESYHSPLETVEVNTVGTVNVMEAVREVNLPVAMVMVTTDKCYENKEWIQAYRETDPLGGYDPYSASKAAAEILISSWRNSFFSPDAISRHGVRMASVRAGNVVGGGDWTQDNIVPDCIRALEQQKVIDVRNPMATRPWQHVLEALGGYLLLGAHLLLENPEEAKRYCEPFNFGPKPDSNKNVQELVEQIIDRWGSGAWRHTSPPHALHEASLLSISIDKAYHLLKWFPQLDFHDTIAQTVDWYKVQQQTPSNIFDFTIEQIRHYQNGSFRKENTSAERLVMIKE